MAHNSSRNARKQIFKRSGVIALAVASCLSFIAVNSTAASAARSTPPVVHNDPLAPVAAQAVLDLHTLQDAGSRTVRDAADATLIADARARYTASRDAIATEIAKRLNVYPARMMQAWAAADYPHQTALMAAFSQLGVRYRRNTSVAGEGFDCSGLTSYAWGVAGFSLAHQSRSQINNAAGRRQDTAQAGDLAYYPGHVMMYLGVDRAMVHAPFTGRTVEVASMNSRKTLRFGDPTS
jgi:cell wall-associated NlpC family hydrolase